MKTGNCRGQEKGAQAEPDPHGNRPKVIREGSRCENANRVDELNQLQNARQPATKVIRRRS